MVPLSFNRPQPACKKSQRSAQSAQSQLRIIRKDTVHAPIIQPHHIFSIIHRPNMDAPLETMYPDDLLLR
jgi:hypothetical protein